MTTAVVAALVLVALVGIGYAVSYNGMVTARQHVDDSWATVDVELDRRHALIPRLVESVSSAAAHERDVLERLVRADANSAAAQHTAADRSEPEAELASAASAVMALRERYPELATQTNFLQLQKELAITEDRIGAARRFYNFKVAESNRRIQAVPGNLIAPRHHIVAAAYFQND